ncbi:IST1 -like protein [Halotydeus destructor]|nr:IST1 -like protein [Halotydeus destructor]
MSLSTSNYSKLKTNLRLAVNRLKLLEKKKAELAMKARKEIADYISAGKYERAKIRVEHIIREDYMVEAMEVVEMYCDLLLARFGLIQQMKTLDEGLAEPVSSLIWVAPRLQADVAELKVIADMFTFKYGKQYSQAARENAFKTVSEKLMHKLSIQAPPKLLVEKYLIEIAKSHNVPYEPDPDVMKEEDDVYNAHEAYLGPPPQNPSLIDFGEFGASGGFGAPPLPSKGPNFGGGGFPPDQTIGFNTGPPPNHIGFQPMTEKPPRMPPGSPLPGSMSLPPGASAPNVSPNTSASLPPAGPPTYDSIVNDPKNKPTPLPRGVQPKPMAPDAFPELPEVPSFSPENDSGKSDGNDPKDETIDFEDLAKRFEALKRRK